MTVMEQPPTQPSTPVTTPITTPALTVLVDSAGRLGPLSYLPPADQPVHIGDAVTVPLGTRTSYGMVIGPGDPALATRPVAAVHGSRARPEDIAVAEAVAHRHLTSIATIAPRLRPTNHKGSEPADVGPLTLADPLPDVPALADVPANQSRRYLLRGPVDDPSVIAAHEILRLAATGGQVLVICPTRALVTKTLKLFSDGAVRLDASAVEGAWAAFRSGGATVGIGTRAAVLYSAETLAGIVVIDEDHPGHIEDRQPSTHARDLAAIRTHTTGAALVLIGGVATPKALGAGVKAAVLGDAGWPTMEALDLSGFGVSDRVGSPELQRAVQDALDASLSPVVVAERQAAKWRCTGCWALATTSKDGKPVKRPCRTCGTLGAKLVGWDKGRLAGMFPDGARIVTRDELASISNAGLVVIADFDPALRRTGTGAEVAAAKLLYGIARAAGRDGRVLVGTSMPDHALMQTFFPVPDLLAFAKRTWAAAEAEEVPPFGRLVTVWGTGRRPAVAGWPGVVHGPRSTRDGWELLVRCDNDDLAELAERVDEVRARSKLRLRVE